LAIAAARRDRRSPAERCSPRAARDARALWVARGGWVRAARATRRRVRTPVAKEATGAARRARLRAARAAARCSPQGRGTRDAARREIAPSRSVRAGCAARDPRRFQRSDDGVAARATDVARLKAVVSLATAAPAATNMHTWLPELHL